MEIPKALVEQLLNENCVVFVGSGLSVGASLPLWQSLLSRMLSWSRDNGVSISDEERDELEMHIKNNELLLVAEEMSERLNKGEYQRFMDDVFIKSNPKPTKAHELITKLPFSAALTSNYDTLLETVYKRESKSHIKVFTHTSSRLSESLRSRDFYIFKVHGDIDHTDTVILGRSDYRKLMHENKAYKRHLETVFSTRTVLFLGFSLTDPDLLFLLDELRTVFQENMGTHYALMDKNKVSSILCKRYKKDYDIVIIPYDPVNDHQEVLVFLNELNEQMQQMKEEQLRSRDQKAQKAFDKLSVEDSTYEIRPARQDELPALYQFCVKFFGNEISPLQQMTEWHEQNPNIFWILLSKEDEASPSIVGYYSVIPLTAEAADLIHREEITGAKFKPEHIVAPDEEPAAIYIGGIAAEEKGKARAWVVGSLVRQLSEMREKKMLMYSRPITQDGLKLLNNYGFIPVHSGDAFLNRIHRSSFFGASEGTSS